MILGSQGGPLERPWEGCWEEKLETQKKIKKKRVKLLASEGHAMAGKEGLGWIGMDGMDGTGLI